LTFWSGSRLCGQRSFENFAIGLARERAYHQPEQGNGSSLEEAEATFPAMDSLRLRKEANQYRAEAARLRAELAGLNVVAPRARQPNRTPLLELLSESRELLL